MSDTELRELARTWRVEGTVEGAAAFVAARLRRGPGSDDERAAWREASARGDREAAEELLLDALLRGDPADVRAALTTLDDGRPDDERAATGEASAPGELTPDAERLIDAFFSAHAPAARVAPPAPDVRRVGDGRDSDGILRAPVSLDWRPPADEGTPGERFVAGWLATLPAAERVLVWVRALLAEPAVTDDERRALLAAALAEERVDVDALAGRHAALTETASRPVLYNAGGYMEGGPPTIEVTFPLLVHDLVRRGLLLDARGEAGLAAATAVVRAVLERPGSLLPSRPAQVRIARVQRFPVWRMRLDGGSSRAHDDAIQMATRQLTDSYPLRAALAVTAALPALLEDERIRGAVDWLVAEGGEREPVARALALHLIPRLPDLPAPLAVALIERAATWPSLTPSSFVDTLLRRGEGLPAAQRAAAARTLRELAARGGYLVDAFEGPLRAALTPDAPWPSARTREPATPAHGPGAWLRELAPDLARALATSSDASARVTAAVLWQGQGPERFPGLTDLWERLSADESEYVREALRAGEAID